MTLDCVKNVSSLRERSSSQGSFLLSEEPPKQQLRGLIFCHFQGIASDPFTQIRVECLSSVTAAAAVPDEYMQLAVHTVVVKVKKLGHILDSSLHHLLHVRFSFLIFSWGRRAAFFVKPRCAYSKNRNTPPCSWPWPSSSSSWKNLLSSHLADAALCLGIFI